MLLVVSMITCHIHAVSGIYEHMSHAVSGIYEHMSHAVSGIYEHKSHAVSGIYEHITPVSHNTNYPFTI